VQKHFPILTRGKSTGVKVARDQLRSRDRH